MKYKNKHFYKHGISQQYVFWTPCFLFNSIFIRP